MQIEVTLLEAGNESSADFSGPKASSNLVNSFKYCDKVIEEQRKHMKQIRHQIIIVNVSTSAVAVVLCFLYYIDEKYDLICMTLLNTMVAISLMGSVLHMRRTIKSTNFVFPNDGLVSVHLILFTVWIGTWVAREFINHR